MKIPSLILKQMYTLGSLKNGEDGVHFSLKNRLADATLTRMSEVRIDNQPVPLDRLHLEVEGGALQASAIGPQRTVPFPLARVVRVRAEVPHLAKGPHEIALAFDTTPFGSLSFKVRDAIAEAGVKRTTVPSDK